MGHKKNECSIFGKTNPIRADEGSRACRRDQASPTRTARPARHMDCEEVKGEAAHRSRPSRAQCAYRGGATLEGRWR
jgi:hypothetical protein